MNIAGCIYGYCAAAAFGSTYGSTGDFGMALKSGVLAGVAQGAFGAIGDAFQGAGFFVEGGLGHIATHAFAGGVLSVLQGGKFGHGFISAGIVKSFAPSVGKVGGWVVNGKSVAQALVAATLGGTVSKVTGGKFANGAITGAFQNLFNQQSQKSTKSVQKKPVDELIISWDLGFIGYDGTNSYWDAAEDGGFALSFGIDLTTEGIYFHVNSIEYGIGDGWYAGVDTGLSFGYDVDGILPQNAWYGSTQADVQFDMNAAFIVGAGGRFVTSQDSFGAGGGRINLGLGIMDAKGKQNTGYFKIKWPWKGD